MIKKFFLLTVAVTSLFSSQVIAKQIPKGVTTESRIREVNYSPNHVVELETAFGYHTTVEFGNETIKTVASGDTIGWQIQPLGNRLFVKPVEDAINGVDSTSITVITDKRNYYFNAFTSKKRNPAFVVRFNYVPNVVLTAKRNQEERNRPQFRDYVVDRSGSQEIDILDVFDDGQFTKFKFNPKKPLPAIYVVNGDNKEEIANIRTEGEYQVFEGVAEKFTVRIGEQHKCVKKQIALTRTERNIPIINHSNR